MSNLVYINFVSQLPDKSFEYEFYFSDEPENVWGDGWDSYNINLISDPTPEKSTYNKVVTLKLPYKLALAQENSCYPMEYAIYCIIALGWIDLDVLDEYPDAGRMVFHFGDTEEKVQEILNPFHINLYEN